MLVMILLLVTIGLVILQVVYQASLLPAIHQLSSAKLDTIVAEILVSYHNENISKDEKDELIARAKIMKDSLDEIQLVDYLLYLKHYEEQDEEKTNVVKVNQKNSSFEHLDNKTVDIVFGTMLANSGILLIFLSPILLLVLLVNLLGVRKSTKERISEYWTQQRCY